jgi:ElaB/YqjD/DUF883 family membrane-anchored ribosome-binding protein
MRGLKHWRRIFIRRWQAGKAMALEATFRALFVQMRKLCDTLNAVLLTVGDKPQNRGAALADELENTVLDILGQAEDARTAARIAEKAVAHPMDLERARRALAKCQENFHRAEGQFANELVSYEKLASLASLGNDRGGEWKPWAGSMKDAIEQGRQPLAEASKALAACWQELVEHGGGTSISVTNTGQKIVARNGLKEELIRERMT